LRGGYPFEDRRGVVAVRRRGGRGERGSSSRIGKINKLIN
jgi:hypothetical protein